VCCGTGESQVCCETPRECCTVYEIGVGESEVCCTETQYCCNDGQGVCCNNDQTCCPGDVGAICCDPGETCCAGVCCPEGECCVDDACVPCDEARPCEAANNTPTAECPYWYRYSIECGILGPFDTEAEADAAAPANEEPCQWSVSSLSEGICCNLECIPPFGVECDDDPP
jgi:hypothetical protein